MSRHHHRDGGFTLTELLVVIVLTGIIGSIVVAAVTTGLRQQTKLQDRNDALAQARTALQRIDRDLRSANPLACATPHTATTSNQVVAQEVGSTTRWVAYSVISQTSTRSEIVVDTTSTKPACGSVTASPSRSILLTNLVNTTTNPVFVFSPGTVTVNVQVQPSTLAQPVVLSDKGVELRNPA